jgi:predicted Fe-Mo cluster-binding NifX family protein
METIGITFWNGLVSPFFDAAATILIVKQDGCRRQVDAGNGSIHLKAGILQKHSVTVLICGAISAEALEALQARGVRVVSWIRGPVDEVLKAFANSTLETDRFFMPGCHRRNRCGIGRSGGMDSGRGQCRRRVQQMMEGHKSTKGKV